MQITVYSKPQCVQCNATYRRLDAKGGPDSYTVVDISVDDQAREFVLGLNYLQAPVVVVRDSEGNITDHWSGYRPDRIDAAISELVAV